MQRWLAWGCIAVVIFGLSLGAQAAKSAPKRAVTRPSPAGALYRLLPSKGAFPGVSEPAWQAQLKAVEKLRMGLKADLSAPIGLFERIRIVPGNANEARLKLPIVEDQRPLEIRPVFNRRTGELEVVSKDEIVKRWNSGEAIGLTNWKVQLAAKVGRIIPAGTFGKAAKAVHLWENYNPLGGRRVLFGRLFGNRVEAISARLATLVAAGATGKKGVFGLRAGLGELVREEALDSSQAQAPGGLSVEELQARIGRSSRKQLADFISSVQQTLSRADLRSSMADSALASVLSRSEHWEQLQKALFAVAAVQNHKRVDVQALLGLQRNQAFEPFMPKVAGEKVQPEQRGHALVRRQSVQQAGTGTSTEAVKMTQDVRLALFIGQFVDDIDVHAQAMVDSGVHKSALSYALAGALPQLAP